MEKIVLPSTAFRDNYSGKTTYLTISIPFDMLMKIEDILQRCSGWSRSGVICFYIHMGLIYCRMLAEKEEFEVENKK